MKNIFIKKIESFKEFFKKHHVSCFEIDPIGFIQMIRIFYGLLAIKYSYLLRSFIDSPPSKNFGLWPTQWMNLFNAPSLILGILIIFGLLTTFACVLFPQLRRLRFLCFLFFFQTTAIHLYNEHHTVIGHSNYAALFISFWLIFIKPTSQKPKNTLLESRNRLYLWAAQISLLGTYFLTGLWKIRTFILYFMENGNLSVNCLAPNVASALIYKNMRDSFHITGLELTEKFGPFLWVIIMLFQISAPLAAWFPPLLRFYACMIILFHISTGALMDIYWHFTQAIALVILIGNPYKRISSQQTKKSLN